MLSFRISGTEPPPGKYRNLMLENKTSLGLPNARIAMAGAKRTKVLLQVDLATAAEEAPIGSPTRRGGWFELAPTYLIPKLVSHLTLSCLSLTGPAYIDGLLATNEQGTARA